MKAILIIASVMAFLIKLAIHVYLDSLSGKPKPNLGGMMPIQYFFPFSSLETNPVNKGTIFLCNFFYVLYICLIIIVNVIY